MKKIFIACDTSNFRKVRKIVKLTKIKKDIVGYKFGLEFFYSKFGRKFLKNFKNNNIFLDLKLNDTPNTCYKALESLKDLKNIRYVTVHINAGEESLKAVKLASKKRRKKIKILGVTILTSLTNLSLRKLGHTKKLKELVKKQVKLAHKIGLDGIICSGHEVKYIKKISKKLEIITPGIRLKGDKSNDQKRIVTPEKAFELGANGIVVGRSITSGNIKNNFKKLLNSLN